MKRTRNGERGGADERAVTELLSFVLVFGTIILAVALLSVVGFQSIQSYQESEHRDTADRTMGALSETFNDILRTEVVTERERALAVRGGRISLGEAGPHIELTVDHDGGTESESWDIGAVVYDVGSETVAYEGGGVFRASDGGERTVLREPRLTCTDETALVSLVTIQEDDRSIQSGGTVSVTATDTGNSYRESFSDVASLEIGFGDERASDRGWEQVFDDEWEKAGDSWRCTGPDGDGVDSVSVHVVEIDIDSPDLK